MTGAIDVKSMIHFASECPNTPTDEETDYKDADPHFSANDVPKLKSY